MFNVRHYKVRPPSVAYDPPTRVAYSGSFFLFFEVYTPGYDVDTGSTLHTYLASQLLILDFLKSTMYIHTYPKTTTRNWNPEPDFLKLPSRVSEGYLP